ncbi:MAG: hypothetical protein GSR87_00970, partial [Desulfurococcales archaeon]|nr:hypothetical protein [Desulfurococcales archaeon]
MKYSKAERRKGLSNLIGALLMIIILVNSLVVLQKYTEQATDNAIEKIRSETPISVRAFSMPNGSIGVYNGETHR